VALSSTTRMLAIAGHLREGGDVARRAPGD
jgi:hypothetical protein